MECTICLCSLVEEDQIGLLKCSHLYHLSCLKKLVKPQCPLCRSNLEYTILPLDLVEMLRQCSSQGNGLMDHQRPNGHESTRGMDGPCHESTRIGIDGPCHESTRIGIGGPCHESTRIGIDFVDLTENGRSTMDLHATIEHLTRLTKGLQDSLKFNQNCLEKLHRDVKSKNEQIEEMTLMMEENQFSSDRQEEIQDLRELLEEEQRKNLMLDRELKELKYTQMMHDKRLTDMKLKMESQSIDHGKKLQLLKDENRNLMNRIANLEHENKAFVSINSLSIDSIVMEHDWLQKLNCLRATDKVDDANNAIIKRLVDKLVEFYTEYHTYKKRCFRLKEALDEAKDESMAKRTSFKAEIDSLTRVIDELKTELLVFKRKQSVTIASTSKIAPAIIFDKLDDRKENQFLHISPLAKRPIDPPDQRPVKIPKPGSIKSRRALDPNPKHKTVGGDGMGGTVKSDYFVNWLKK